MSSQGPPPKRQRVKSECPEAVKSECPEASTPASQSNVGQTPMSAASTVTEPARKFSTGDKVYVDGFMTRTQFKVVDAIYKAQRGWLYELNNDICGGDGGLLMPEKRVFQVAYPVGAIFSAPNGTSPDLILLKVLSWEFVAGEVQYRLEVPRFARRISVPKTITIGTIDLVVKATYGNRTLKDYIDIQCYCVDVQVSEFMLSLLDRLDD